jgi:hypothetical protein
MKQEQAKVPDNQTAEVDDDTAATDQPLSEADYRAYWEWCLDRCRIDYAATANPMFAFLYVKARRLGIAPPDWTLE